MDIWLKMKEKLLYDPQTLTKTALLSRLVKVNTSMLTMDVDNFWIKAKFAPAAHHKWKTAKLVSQWDFVTKGCIRGSNYGVCLPT